MSVNDHLAPATFGNLSIPYTSRTVKLANRFHAHEFPKQAAAAMEKLGRKPYVFTFSGCPFHESNLQLPNLYTKTLPALQSMAEAITTTSLLIPEVGAIMAFISSFERTRKGAIRSGEDVNLEFMEDASAGFGSTTIPSSVNVLVSAAGQLTILSAPITSPPGGPGMMSVEGFNLLQQILAAVDKVTGAIDNLTGAIASVGDQANLYGNLLQAKLEKIATLCKTIDATEAVFKQPQNSPVMQALHDVWDAADQTSKDSLQQGTPVVQYVVPATQAVATIAQSIYGDSSRGGQILQLNHLPDPFAVKAGTTLNVYAK